MIVLDASAVVAGLAGDDLVRGLLADEDVHVPHLADCEVASALRALVLRGAVGADEAGRLLAGWSALGVRRHAATGLLGRIWALRDRLTAYEATYVALAEALSCPLLTRDEALARAPGLGCEVIVPAA